MLHLSNIALAGQISQALKFVVNVVDSLKQAITEKLIGNTEIYIMKTKHIIIYSNFSSSNAFIFNAGNFA